MKTHIIPAVRRLALVAGIAALAATAHAGQYGETFQSLAVGTASLPAATGELFSNQPGTTARVADDAMRELQLTSLGTSNTRTAFRLPDLDPGSVQYAFSAKWNTQIYGNLFFGLADGFSFNFGPLGGITATSFTNGTFQHEDGFGAGLTVSVRTHADATPGYYVRVNGATVPGGFVAKPTEDWGSYDADRHFFEVDWHAGNGLTLRVDGVAIFTNLPTPGFVPAAGGRFVFGARTGGVSEEVRLDNIVVLTGGVLAPLAEMAPYHFSGQNLPNEGAARAFDGDAATKWLTVSSASHLGASFASAKTVRAYALTSANDVPARDPRNWNFQPTSGGVPQSSNPQADQSFQHRLERRAFIVASPAPGMEFLAGISATKSGGPETQLAEFETWELTPGPLPPAVTLAPANSSVIAGGSVILTATPGEPGLTFAWKRNGLPFSPETGPLLTVDNLLAADNGAVFTVTAMRPADGIPTTSNAVSVTVAPGGATNFIVTTTAGNGPGSLREALHGAAASGAAGGRTITFAAALDGQAITLASVMTAAGANSVSVDASALPGGVKLDGNNATSILIVDFGASLTLKGLTLTRGNGTGDLGGAITNLGTLALSRCTLSGNSAPFDGGAIFNLNIGGGGDLTLTACTVSGNTALGANSTGGGIVNSNGTLTLRHCTVAGNSTTGAGSRGGGVFHESGPDTFILENSVIAGNTAASGADIHRASDTITTSGANLIGDNHTTLIAAGPLVGTSASPLAARLSPLGNYGGPTQTRALQPGSPARNTAIGSSITGDQRGFPIVGTPDIGAYEAGTLTDFAAWSWETLPATATPAQHAATFDFESDGRINFLEYAALSAGDAPDPGALPVFTRNTAGTVGTLVFPYRAAADLFHTLERSTDLTGAWTPVFTYDGATGQTASIGGITASFTATEFTITDTFIAGQPRVFYRMKVTQ